MLQSFVSEHIGLMVPGNDVMSAIVSLFIEVFSYGILIFSLILFLLCYIIDNFTHDGEHFVVRLSWGQQYLYDWNYPSQFWLFTAHVFSLITSLLVVPYDRAGYSYVSFPASFKKWEESFLDICFLVFPTVVVILMLAPTLGFLYNNHFILYNVLDTSISIDVIGHQWYWSYEYNLGSDGIDFMFDSILDIDATVNAYLDVDYRLVIPSELLVTLSITSTDVIHSWAVPNLGVKVDAVPGRVSTCTLFTFVDGVFYGQCSELCGVLHGFMPICVESITMDLFFNWVILPTYNVGMTFQPLLVNPFQNQAN